MNSKVDDYLDQVKRIALQQIESLRNSGLQVIPKPSGNTDFGFTLFAEDSGSSDPESTEIDAAKPTTTTREHKAGFSLDAHTQKQYESSPLDLPSRGDQLKQLQQSVASCTKCQELASCRNNTVFGVGNVAPDLCFLGEGPGADEDRQGEPFVGQAGQLLNKIIGACKMSREEVYILNTVKCRPPGNRNPNDQELENCWPYAIQQLEILQPRYICCLGSVAARTLLKTRQSIGKMRGQFFQYRGSQVVVTYHPAYLLRNPSAKRQVWDDMKMLLAAMGREI